MKVFFYIFNILIFCFSFFSCKTNSYTLEKPFYSDNFVEEIYLPIKGNLQEIPILPENKWYTWSRDEGKIISTVSNLESKPLFEFSHNSDLDYSISISKHIPISKNSNYIITANAFIEQGELSPCFITRDYDGNVIDWVAGISTIKEGNGYQAVSAIISVDSTKVATIEPRFIGYNHSKVKIINTKVQEFSMDNLEKTKIIQNDILKVECFTQTASFTITDKRNGKVYSQSQDSFSSIIILDSKTLSTENQITLIGYNTNDKTNVYFRATLNDDSV